MTVPAIIDPQSNFSRYTSLLIFSLALILLVAGLTFYDADSIHNLRPYDDMVGDADWAELMLLGFVSSFSLHAGERG